MGGREAALGVVDGAVCSVPGREGEEAASSGSLPKIAPKKSLKELKTDGPLEEDPSFILFFGLNQVLTVFEVAGILGRT